MPNFLFYERWFFIKNYNLKIKKYINGLTVYKNCLNYSINYDFQKSPRPGTRGMALNREKSINYSMKRTKEKIFDIALSNNWEYFITLTFSIKKVTSRFDYNSLTKELRKYLKNLHNYYSPNLKYLLVPDYHKNGAIHFHGLISNIGSLPLTISKNSQKDKKGNLIYNLPNYKKGFSTATKIKNSNKASAYMLKYITKSLCDLTFNKKRYFRSNNLLLPNTETLFITEPLEFSNAFSNSSNAFIKNYNSTLSYFDNSKQIQITKKCTTDYIYYTEELPF